MLSSFNPIISNLRTELSRRVRRGEGGTGGGRGGEAERKQPQPNNWKIINESISTLARFTGFHAIHMIDFTLSGGRGLF